MKTPATDSRRGAANYRLLNANPTAAIAEGVRGDPRGSLVMARASLLLITQMCVLGAGFAPSQLSARAARPAAAASVRMMPLGIPKVPYRMPGSQQGDWIDIYNRLYRERIIFLGEDVNDEVVNQIIAVMLFADSEDPEKTQYLYINSPGGSVTAGLALYDTMGHISSETCTVNVGMAASMGSFLLGAGARGKRIALPHSRTMIHQPMGGARGQAEDIRIQAEQVVKITNTLVDAYSKMTGQTRERVYADLDRDNWMNAEQARHLPRLPCVSYAAHPCRVCSSGEGLRAG